MPKFPALTPEYELNHLRKTGSLLFGVDEAGRGPWAGPLIISAVALISLDYQPVAGIYDSKSLSKPQRELAFVELEAQRAQGLISIYTEWVSAVVISEQGLAAAIKSGIVNLEKLIGEHSIIADAGLKFTQPEGGNFRKNITKNIIKGDQKYYSIAAAAIVSKVLRDRYLVRLAEKYPGYGFAQHKGYGTKQHQQALVELGVCPEHRTSFAPVARILAQQGRR